MSNAKGSDSHTAVPNLYKLLGLADCHVSSTAIEAAISKLEAQALCLPEQQVRKRDQTRQLVRVAKTQLLDSEQRVKFDAVWRSQYSPEAVTAKPLAQAEPASASAQQRLLTLLPGGSPESPFDLAAFLATETQVSAVEKQAAGFRSLLQVVDDTGACTGEKQASNSPIMQAKAIAAGQNRTTAAPAINRPATSLSRNLRKRNNFLLPSIGLLACLAVVMALALYLMRDEQGDAGIDVTANARGSDAEKLAGAVAEPKPRRSGLPQLAGLDNGELADSNPRVDNGAGMGTDQGTEASLPDEDNPFLASPPISAPMPGPSTPPAMPAEKEVSPSPLTDMQLASWQSDLLAIGAALTRYEYSKAKEILAQYKEESLPPDQQARRTRVARIIELAEQGHERLVAAIAGLGAAEVINVGTSAKVSFVEGDAEHIVVRLRNGRQEYQLGEMPPGILYSLLDLSMDMVNETAQAQRAALILFHQNRSARTLAKARELLVNATMSDAIADDLIEIFDDGLLPE